MTRTAYSYIRFSKPEQLKGDSLRRQLDASERLADKHGWPLDQTLSLRDLGVSAFRGRNAERGALKAFLDAVEEGT
jgi:DNA invertase Pin-like site-specific DNA recombinase